MADTVTVACKIPNGVILRLHRMETRQEMILGGGMRDVKTAIDTGQRITINGNRQFHSKPKLDESGDQIQMMQSFGLTHNVDAKFWDEWLEQNRETDMVRNGMIFASGDGRELRAAAKDLRDRNSGMEPMRTDSDPRMPARRTQLRSGGLDGFGPDRAG